MKTDKLTTHTIKIIFIKADLRDLWDLLTINILEGSKIEMNK